MDNGGDTQVKGKRIIEKRQVILNVLETLEKVFADEQPYDESLMELQLHTAEVRKQFPNLFQAIQFPKAHLSDLAETDHTKEVADAVISALVDWLTSHPATVRVVEAAVRSDTTQSSAEPVPATVGRPIYQYTTWAVNEARTSTVGSEWAAHWDIPNVPMPTEGSSITLRGIDKRIRFQVIGFIDETTPVFKTVALLGLTGD